MNSISLTFHSASDRPGMRWLAALMGAAGTGISTRRISIKVVSSAMASIGSSQTRLQPGTYTGISANVEILQGGHLALDNAVGHRIVCRSGRLWVTQVGEPQDAALLPGQEVVITKPGKTLISALRPSTVGIL